MKKAYKRPVILVERFVLTQRLSNCSLHVGFQDENCVLNDSDATNEMKELALNGYFYAGACEWYPQYQDYDDGVCYHTSVNLAFSS